MPGLSCEILIPSYNRWNTLLTTVAKIRQLYPTVPVCLGLQGEWPDKELPPWISSDPNLRIEKMPKPSSTITMTACIGSSKADVILILDDDAGPCQGWLETHVAAFESDPGLVYTGGREVRLSKGIHAFSVVVRILVETVFGFFMPADRKINGRIVGWFNWIGLFFGNFDQPGTAVINNTRGCNMAVRREAFLAAGGFCPDIIGNGYLFEVEFGLRLARQGKLGRYLGNAIVIHQESPTGGSRASARMKWFFAFVHNHRQVMKIVGPQGWIGSVPRLVKRLLF
jgi:GT2 family glycosyltransferase